MQPNVHFQLPVDRGRERFRELIVYISRKCENDAAFGATKLNQILFYSDFEAYRRLGQPLTGLPYFRLGNGPAPRWLIPIRLRQDQLYHWQEWRADRDLHDRCAKGCHPLVVRGRTSVLSACLTR